MSDGGDDSSGVLSIGAVAALTGVPVGTLRTWERRYGVVVPRRTATGHRRYAATDVEALRWVAGELGRGVPAADAFRVLEGRRGREAGRRRPVPAADGTGEPDATVALAIDDDATLDLVTRSIAALGRAPRPLRPGEEPPDDTVVVLDAAVDGAAGFEMCRRLSARVPVVLLSSFGDAERAHAAGAAAFVPKPASPAEVRTAIASALPEAGEDGRS